MRIGISSFLETKTTSMEKVGELKHLSSLQKNQPRNW